MKTPLAQKSTTQEITARFDREVDRFANLETGQTATMDAPLVLELISRAAAAATPHIGRVLDIGCGAGNSTIKLLGEVGPFACDLLDLSGPMLARARERTAVAGGAPIITWQGDFRTLELPREGYDVILSAAVLHHLRDDADWEAAFAKLYTLTAPGGSVWISDLVAQENTAVSDLLWARYGDYLRELGGEELRARVFAYIDKEDSPRPVTYQLELLRRVGFAQVDLLHKNAVFAAFGAVKQA